MPVRPFVGDGEERDRPGEPAGHLVLGRESPGAQLSAALEEIRQRADAATPGPWWSDDSDICWRLHGVGAVIPAQLHDLIPEQTLNKQILKAPKLNAPYAEYWPDKADAEFIVNARTDVPRLLAVAKLALAQHRPSLYPASGPGAGDAHGKHYCAGACHASIDHQSIYAVWPCKPYRDLTAALLGEADRG